MLDPLDNIWALHFNRITLFLRLNRVLQTLLLLEKEQVLSRPPLLQPTDMHVATSHVHSGVPTVYAAMNENMKLSKLSLSTNCFYFLSIKIIFYLVYYMGIFYGN